MLFAILHSPRSSAFNSFLSWTSDTVFRWKPLKPPAVWCKGFGVRTTCLQAPNTPPQGKHISIKMHSRGGHPIEQESLVSVNKQMVSHAPLLLVKLKHSKIIHPALSSNWAHYLCQTRTNCRMEGKTDPRTALPMPVMRIYRSQEPTAAHKVQITPEELFPSKDER